MNYSVYRVVNGDGAPRSYILLAQTRYREDADTIYAKWNSAYIVDAKGEMIASKGF